MSSQLQAERPKPLSKLKYPHVVIDLETLALVPNACVVQIGLTHISPGNGLSVHGDGSSTSLDVDITDQFMRGGQIDSATARWWKSQEAYSKVFNTDDRCSMFTALREISSPGYFNKETRVWSNGKDFDLSILAFWFGVYKLPIPWNFRLTRCWRQVYQRHKATVKNEKRGIEHLAVDDAINCANWLRACPLSHWDY